MTSLMVQHLEEMIDQATSDRTSDADEICGFFLKIEEALDVPFHTNLLGSAVTVQRIELTNDDRIVALCRRGKEIQRVELRSLPLPMPLPEGAEWIVAYRHWLRRMGRSLAG